MSEWTIFGERLSHRMREYDISFGELSRRTGISVTTLHRYATSKRIPRITEFMKCADTLHTTVDYMLGLSDDPHLTGKGERIRKRGKRILVKEKKRVMADVKQKMDLRTAEYIADKARNDRSVFPIEFYECEKCGAAYIEKLGHDCNNVIELTWHTKEDADEIEYDE